jgi:glycosyltransferase involved in cell wall biosynthesis
MGVPCVGSRAAGLEEVILEGETGWLADSGDPESLAAAIDRALSDRAARDRAGERARACVRRDFDTDRNFDRMCALFGGIGPVAGAGVPRSVSGVERTV